MRPLDDLVRSWPPERRTEVMDFVECLLTRDQAIGGEIADAEFMILGTGSGNGSKLHFHIYDSEDLQAGALILYQ